MTNLAKLLKITIMLFATLFSTGLCAEIYKWVDENGEIHYSEIPPKNTQASKVRADKSTTDPTKAMETLREKNSAFSERRDERLKKSEELATAKNEKTKNKKVCDQLRAHLDTLTTNNQVRVTKDGEATMLSDQQRLDTIEEVKKQIADNC